MSEIVVRIDTDNCTHQCDECVIKNECKDKQKFYRKLDLNSLNGMSRTGLELSLTIMHEDCVKFQNALIDSVEILKKYWTFEEKKRIEKHLEGLKLNKILEEE